MTIPRDDILRMAREAGFDEREWRHIRTNVLEHFAHLVIEDFLTRTGQYLTNGASREAAIAEAVAAEREAIIAACRAKADDWQKRPGRWQHHQGAAIGALACVELVEERGRM